MRKHGISFLAVSVILLLAMFLPALACAPAAAPPPTTTPAKPPAATTSAPPAATTPAATTPAAPAVKTGGILRYNIAVSPPHWDSHNRPSYGPTVTSLVFNQLVRFDPDEVDLSPSVLIGDLAEKWEVAPDGKAITFNLRKNVKWHDGKPFTSDDVVYSVEKMMDPKRSQIAGNFPAYDGVAVLDANTVKINLKQASPGFLMQLATVYANIQPRSSAGVDNKSTAFLNGIGPFKIKTWTSGVSAELVKNPDYFIPGRPYLDGVTLLVIADRGVALDALIGGRLDMLTPFGGIYTEELLDRITQLMPKAPVGVSKPPQNNFFWLNTANPYLKDVRVRKALGLVTDQFALATAGYGSDKWTVPNRGIFSTVYGLSDDDIKKITGWDKAWDARVAEAKKLMADAGFASGFKLVLLTSKIAEYERAYVYYSDILKRNLNIDCEIKSLATAEAWALRDKGQFDVWMQEIIASTGDPDDVTSSFRTGGLNNYINYSNPEVDKLFDQQTVTNDLKARIAMTQQIERLVLSDYVVIPARGSIYRTAWAPYVKGFVLPNAGYGGQLVYDRVWLDK